METITMEFSNPSVQELKGRSELLIVDGIFDDAPTNIYADGIENQLNKLDELRDERSTLLAELRCLRSEISDLEANRKTIESEHKAILDRCLNDDTLKYAIDLVDGKITHIVAPTSFRIIDFDEWVKELDRSEYHLLTFQFYPPNSFSIRLGGCSGYTGATSLDDAKQKLQKAIDSLDPSNIDFMFIASWRRGDLKSFRLSEELLEALKVDAQERLDNASSAKDKKAAGDEAEIAKLESELKELDSYGE